MNFKDKRLIIICVLLYSLNLYAGGNKYPDFSYYEIIIKRNVFRQLWGGVKKTEKELELERQKKSELDKLEHEKKLAEMEKQDEARKLENRKKQLESVLMLTGIVFDGENVTAFIQNNMRGDETITVKKGDVFDDLKVISINEEKGLVILDNDGLFKVELYLKK